MASILKYRRSKLETRYEYFTEITIMVIIYELMSLHSAHGDRSF